MAQEEVTFTGPQADFAVDFPHLPVTMQFDLLDEDGIKGHLDVFTTAVKNGVLMTCVIQSPTLQEKKGLEEHFFQRILYTCIVRRLCYQPQPFEKEANIRYQQMTWQEQPALRFVARYMDQQPRIMEGIALMQGDKLYLTFVLTNEDDDRSDIRFSQFLQSFHLLKL